MTPELLVTLIIAICSPNDTDKDWACYDVMVNCMMVNNRIVDDKKEECQKMALNKKNEYKK